MGARGLNKNDFCNRLGIREIGGYTLFQHLKRDFCDISLLINLSNRQVSHF